MYLQICVACNLTSAWSDLLYSNSNAHYVVHLIWLALAWKKLLSLFQIPTRKKTQSTNFCIGTIIFQKEVHNVKKKKRRKLHKYCFNIKLSSHWSGAWIAYFGTYFAQHVKKKLTRLLIVWKFKIPSETSKALLNVTI